MAAAICPTGRWAPRAGTLTKKTRASTSASRSTPASTFFDTADVYSIGLSEEITGAHLKEMAVRDQIVVATKVHGVMGPSPNQRGLSRKHIIEACDNSLRRLQMDYVDLYQIHRWDPKTPIEETLDALDSLVRAGKVRYLGASSMAAWQLSKALYTAKENGWHRFVSMQNHYNLVYREEERETIPLCVDQGLAVIPWSPLARGFLTGNRRRDGDATTRATVDTFAKDMYHSEDDFVIADAVAAVAKKRGVSAAQIACAWVLQAPGVTAPIIGATKAAHLKDVIGAVDLKLTAEEIAALEKTLSSAQHPGPRPTLREEHVEARLKSLCVANRPPDLTTRRRLPRLKGNSLVLAVVEKYVDISWSVAEAPKQERDLPPVVDTVHRRMLQKIATPHGIRRSAKREFPKLVKIAVLQGREKRSHIRLDLAPLVRQRSHRGIVRCNQCRTTLCATAAV